MRSHLKQCGNILLLDQFSISPVRAGVRVRWTSARLNSGVSPLAAGVAAQSHAAINGMPPPPMRKGELF